MDRRTRDVEFATGLIRDCAGLARRVQLATVVSAVMKDDRSPVTVADFSVQALAARRLGLHDPETPLLAEESAGLLRKPESRPLLEQIAGFVSEVEAGASPEFVVDWIDRGQGSAGQRFWVLDPVDGTKGFLRDAQYVVALALVEGGEVTLGALGCPRLDLQDHGIQNPEHAEEGGCLVVASKGEGAWVTGLHGGATRRLAVSTIDDPAEAVAVRSVETGHTNVEQLDALLHNLGSAKPAVAVDSQAKYALLADGYGDFLTRLVSVSRPDYREKIWDQAPGTVVVTEAGGRVTDLDGRELDFTTGRQLLQNRGVLASNGLLHKTLLAELRKLGA
jgi:3'(2'), 5'-bisphosphate nucleotidase